jgi:hypothetical protein
MAEGHGFPNETSLVVGPAPLESREHASQNLWVAGPTVETQLTTDSTHAGPPPSKAFSLLPAHGQLGLHALHTGHRSRQLDGVLSRLLRRHIAV